MTLVDTIRNYVLDHEKCVTFSEVKKFIENETQIKTTPSGIRGTFYKVIEEEGAVLKRKGLSEEIRFFLIEQHKKGNKDITTDDVIKFIYSKGYEKTEYHIRVATSQVSKELGIKLRRKKKPDTLINAIRTYVIEHDKIVTNGEVENYINCETSIKATKESIRITLYNVLNEEEGTLKRMGLKEEIRFYLIEQHKKGNKYITTDDVVKFIYSKGYEKTEHHIRTATYQVSKELGIKLFRKETV